MWTATQISSLGWLVQTVAISWARAERKNTGNVDAACTSATIKSDAEMVAITAYVCRIQYCAQRWSGFWRRNPGILWTAGRFRFGCGE
nr:MFS transporter [Mesorhizobium sp. AR02]